MNTLLWIMGGLAVVALIALFVKLWRIARESIAEDLDEDSDDV